MEVLQNVSETTTFSEALTNTALGMGTVFLVLILISFIIYLFKFIPKLMEIGKKKPEASAPAQSQAKQETTPATAPQATDDTQLVAVIAAAIAAQMSEETGVPVAAAGLVIRSIKKRTFSI